MDENKYLIYQSLLGNVRIINKKMLMLIVNPELADKVESDEVKRYVKLFKKEGYIEMSNPEVKNSTLKNIAERNVLNIDLSGEYLSPSKEESLLVILKDILSCMERNKLYVTIKDGFTPVKYDLIQRIIKILSQFNNKNIQLCIRFPIEVLTNDRWIALSFPKDTALEVYMKELLVPEFCLLEKLINIYDTRNIIIRYRSKNININVIYIEEVFKKIKNNFIRFNLDIEFIKADNPSQIIEKIIEIQELAKLYQVNVFGWWYKPFENIINSNPNSFCNTYESQISIGLRGEIQYCKQHCALNIQERYSDFENRTKSFEEKVKVRRNLCYGCKIEGFCKEGCIYWREQDRNFICDFLIEVTERLLVMQYS